jgi:two-component system sensor kinase FixL
MLVHGDAKHKAAVVAELIAEARALAAVGHGEAGIAYRQSVAPSLSVLADPIQIQQVLLNLMRNAVESMEGVENPRLSISARRKREMVEIVVRDTGPGIDPAVRDQLFEPFASTKEEGMGVGLSICRTIVEAHGGRIWAESADGEGTAFHLTLPAAQKA